MKEGWTKNTIKGICCKLFAGGDVPKEEFSKTKTEKYYVPIYANGVENNGLYGYTDIARVNEPAITISGRGTIGYISIRREPFCPVVRLITLIPDLNVINLDYLYYALLSLDFSHSGTSIPQLTVPMVKDIEIGYPTKQEQQRIVSRLDSAFAHIDELKANAEKQLSEARVLFQKALTKAMEPKEGWKYKKLGEVGITQTGTTPSKSNPNNYGNYIPFIRPAEISIDGSGHINYDSEIKLSEEGLKNGRLFKKGATLMVCIGSIGKLGYAERNISCNQQINVITPFDEYYPKYIFYAMSSPAFQEECLKIAQGAQATLPIINKGKWSNLLISIPSSREEQQRIVSRLDSLSAHVRELEEVLQKTIAECDALKQALLRAVFE